MACGSVVQSEGAISLVSLNLTRCDLTSSSAASEKGESNSNWSRKLIHKGDDVHEAILFLQKEHEVVLSGLHQQVTQLQEKCDDLQFEAHLKHLTSTEEDTLRKKVTELTSALNERNQQVTLVNQQLEQQQQTMEEEREQFRWKELKLQQQIEVSDQRTVELKGEVSRLKAQVHDLKVFSSALRTTSSGPSSTGGGIGVGGSQRLLSASKSSLTSPKPSLSIQRTSQESLDSLGPRSLGSEEGDVGMWREARLGSGGGKLASLRGSTRPQSGSLPPLTRPGGSPRPSSSVSSVLTLPPISKGKGVGGRPHVRRQLRLLSAPSLDFPPKSPRQPP